MRNETKSVTVQAKSIDLALKKAATELNTLAEKLDHELISQTDAGILSFLGGRKVEIRAWLKAPVRTQDNRRDERRSRRDFSDRGHSESDEPAVSSEPLTADELKNLVDDLQSFCARMCEFMIQKTGVEVSTSIEDDKLTLDIRDDEVAAQIGKNTRLAESMEHLLRKKPRYLKRELPFRIFVDANAIRVNREKELTDMARDLSSKVAENQRPIVLNYRSSYDRKIIHMALDKDQRVYTKSIGTGTNRKLMILPVKADGTRGEQQSDS